MTTPSLTVDETGPLALLQDLGRHRVAHLGVSPSGAADRGALRLANRLLGNDEGATAVETTFGGLAVTAGGLVWVTVTGAATTVLINGRAFPSHSTVALQPGDRLQITPPPDGVRNYLGVRGGIEATPVLGSCSRDVLSGLGPDPLRRGQRLAIGQPRHRLPDTDFVAPPRPDRTLVVSAGPRADWFETAAWDRLLSDPWTVTADCDRVAVRLSGPTLGRARLDELPSEGLLRGAVQVPSSGQPLIFLADHPVTGGYPVLAVLTDEAADRAAQLRPGDTVRFVTRRRVGEETRRDR